ncbi:zinc-binding dehydrogenase [Rhodococcus baikonurensis]|uniref:alcohol dehydrogenase n=1 Tax=Rhodococcus baikonurensis TaxID=172041 RepID=A0ABV5XMA6_9NOCA
MKAWLFTEVNSPLELVELPDPIAGPGEVVVDVKGAGLCHSDVGIIEGPGLPWIAKRPIILGHEVGGIITDLGEGVTGHSIGDRVTIGYLKPPPWGPGLGRDGGYAEKTVIYEDEIIDVPDNVSLVQAAVALDSAATSYHAVHTVGGVTKDSVVGIIGLGGLGLAGARFAALTGATVYGVDTNEGVFAEAERLGVTQTYTDAADLVQHSPDVVVDFAGFETTTSAALHAVRQGGIVVQVGLGSIETTISKQDLVLKHVRLEGSLGSSQEDLKAVLGLISTGVFTPKIEQISFDKIGEGISRLQKGGLTGRLAAALD